MNKNDARGYLDALYYLSSIIEAHINPLRLDSKIETGNQKLNNSNQYIFLSNLIISNQSIKSKFLNEVYHAHDNKDSKIMIKTYQVLGMNLFMYYVVFKYFSLK